MNDQNLETEQLSMMIADENLQSVHSRDIAESSVHESREMGTMEDIAQRIFDQDVHDLSFEESVTSDENSQAQVKTDHSAFVEVSHFQFFTTTVVDSPKAVEAEREDTVETVAAMSQETAESSPEAPALAEETTKLTPPEPGQNLLQNLCDDELIQEIKSIPQRLNFKIGDVADLLGIKPFVLRYWETEFDVLKPKKAHNKQRIYTRREVENAFLIRKLLHRDRFSIEGARNALKQAKQSLKQQMEMLNAAPVVPVAPVVATPLVAAVVEVEVPVSEPVVETSCEDRVMEAVQAPMMITENLQLKNKEAINERLANIRSAAKRIQEMFDQSTLIPAVKI